MKNILYTIIFISITTSAFCEEIIINCEKYEWCVWDESYKGTSIGYGCKEHLRKNKSQYSINTKKKSIQLISLFGDSGQWYHYTDQPLIHYKEDGNNITWVDHCSHFGNTSRKLSYTFNKITRELKSMSHDVENCSSSKELLLVMTTHYQCEKVTPIF